jgi:hypothetical protein
MQRFIAAAFAAGALAVSAAPALAQYGPPPGDARDWNHHDDHRDWGRHDDQGGGWDVDRRIDWLQQRIDRGAADGSLDRHEARRAQFQLRLIVRDEHSIMYKHGGQLTDRDRAIMEARLDKLNDQIRWLRANDERRPW